MAGLIGCKTIIKNISGGSSTTVQFASADSPKRYSCLVTIRRLSPNAGHLVFVATGYGASASRNTISTIGTNVDDVTFSFSDSLEGFIINNTSSVEAQVNFSLLGNTPTPIFT